VEVYKIRYKIGVSQRPKRPLRGYQLPGCSPPAPGGSFGWGARISASAPLSYTLRRTFSGAHARTGSWATFDFPQNSFVWENKKIDSRPPNHKTVLHAFFRTGSQINCLDPLSTLVVVSPPWGACGRLQVGLKSRCRVSQPTLYLPYTTRPTLHLPYTSSTSLPYTTRPPLHRLNQPTLDLPYTYSPLNSLPTSPGGDCKPSSGQAGSAASATPSGMARMRVRGRLGELTFETHPSENFSSTLHTHQPVVGKKAKQGPM
jgi:hypothetical protein